MKISSEETKKMTGLNDAGLRKIRKIYQKDKRLKCRELFSEKQVEEIIRIVQYQRAHPHSSYEMAYEAVTMKRTLEKILTENPDDFTGGASLVIGEKNLDIFFEKFNDLSDFLMPIDRKSAQILINLQPLILAKIALKAPKSNIQGN